MRIAAPSPRSFGAAALAAVLALGCAQLPHLQTPVERRSYGLAAGGPGTVFESIERAAVDALTWSYLRSLALRNPERMRAGTIYPVDGGYSYGEVHIASPLRTHQVRYALAPRDVARFAIYPEVDDYRVDRINERPSSHDRHSVDVTDPRHRPLYVLHPSLAIRQYRGKQHALVEVANLRRPSPLLFFAGN